MSERSSRGAVGAAEFVFTTGKLALQADGAVLARVGATEVLATAVANRKLREGVDFFPLTVDVEERMYAVGKIPGSFFRREGRPTERAILSARLVDRPLRPSFRDGYRCETHVVATVISADEIQPYDVIALNAASAALMVSSIPFEGPIAGVRLAYSHGAWIPMPSYEQLADSVFELVVAGRRNAENGIDIVMVEAGATENGLRLVAAGQAPTDEAAVALGLEESKGYLSTLIDAQLDLRKQVEIAAEDWPTVEDYSSELYAKVESAAKSKVAPVVKIAPKQERNTAEEAALAATLAELGITPDHADLTAATRAFRSVMKKAMRERVVKEGIRLDGRGLRDVRPISVEVGLVPRAHGSGLFQRGETQVLNVTTVGMLRMEQMLDTIGLEESKRYMHHYNFPPFSTGEVGFMRGPKRREIGHGALAEKALLPVIPTAAEFPYAFRLVSEVLASNGSSSMASVCGSTLSLMDCGVPISAPVAGVAMGLVAHEGGFATLTDILGAEDALGDMDFKVAGTADMITALQLDTKIEGLPAEVLAGALDQAREARLFILGKMAEVIAAPRTELNPIAPRIEAVMVPKDKLGEIIGPKGKVIREIEEKTGATLEIEDDGTVRIGAADGDALRQAKEWVLSIAFPPEVEMGKEYEGEVVNITKFGAFVNILPGRDGLLHISKIGGGKRIENVEDVYSLGDKVQVVVREIDDRGKVSLDLAGAEPSPVGEGDGGEPRAPREPREPRGERSGGDRGGDRGGRDRGPRRSSGDRGGERRSAPSTSATSSSAAPSKAGRKVVSFEDDFEAGK
ncbi:MAG TPA: polyribonucleotide nucleotidyltransferase [Acidimicrobiia bacterium]|nr:polyribonucleotide nucleotidyltransferase [Acidimicrobiia bacterium]